MREPSSKGPSAASRNAGAFKQGSCARQRLPVDGGHVFPDGFLSYKMTDFLICHVTPDRLDFVAYGIFVLYVDITLGNFSHHLLSFHLIRLH